MSPTPKRNLCPLIFVIITCVCVLFSLVYVFGAAHKNSVLAVDPAVGSPLRAAAESPLRTEKVSLRETLQQQPHLVRINQNSSSDLGKVEIAAIAAGKNAQFVTNLRCERMHYAANQGICLTRKIKHTTANTAAMLFGPDFQPQFTFTTPGIPSRARVAPDGRHAAFTVFVLGHSYTDAQMSTATFLLDTATGAPIANLEEFAVWRTDKLIQSPDLNFWGVTFAHDSNFFYATLRTGGQTYLVHGDIKARKVTLLHENVECPSLSPDEKRVVFKKLITRANWRLTALDLTTFTETPLAETKSVDDQAEWLDNNHVLYGMPEPNSPPWMDVMIVPADGSGQHQILAQGASSPAVVP